MAKIALPPLLPARPGQTHLLFTRYNIGLYSGGPYAHEIEDPDAWMEHRLALFYRTASSIRLQHNQQFTWLVVIDPATPTRFADQIKQLLPANGRLCHASTIFLDDLAYATGERFAWPAGGPLITSRVDSDDMLLPGFVEAIQAAVGDRAEVIDTLGWVTDTTTGETRVPKWDGQAGSMFVSLVEPGPPYRTVCAYEHLRIVDDYPTTVIDERLWVICVHDANLRNREYA